MSYYYDDRDPMAMYQAAMMQRRGGRAQRFDEYYRCYPIAMMPGPERETANHGGKLFLPASALDKLTQLHITYPMLFELVNGSKGLNTHAGVLEFTAEEGRCYLPYWLMQRLQLEAGDLVQTKSTDLPPGQFIKLQPQDTNFLDISDPKAVLETAFRNFSCLTVGDVFTFLYNETVYEIAVLELRPSGDKKAISVQETDLEVDFAPPVGYQEPQRQPGRGSGTNTPGNAGGIAGKGGMVHTEGSMAQAINYSSIAPSASAAALGAAKASSNFSGSGNRLVSKKSKSSSSAPAASPASTTGTSTPTISASSRTISKHRNGPQPLRLPPGKLFFGYEIKPVRRTDGQDNDSEQPDGKKHHFTGEGQTLRKKKDGKK